MGLLATIGTAVGASAANAAAVGAAVVSTATAAVSGAANYIQQSQNAEAQAEYQKQVNENITEATIENYHELGKAEQDALYNAGQDSLQNQINALKEASALEAYSSATGARGGATNMLLTDIMRKKAVGETDIRMARDQQLRNIDSQAKALQRGAQASYINTPIQKPSVWTSAAQGASTAANAYGTVTKLDKAWRDSSKVGSGV